MRATSSSTEKTAILAQSNAFIHNVLEATYNPYKQYYVTSKTWVDVASSTLCINALLCAIIAVFSVLLDVALISFINSIKSNISKEY